MISAHQEFADSCLANVGFEPTPFRTSARNWRVRANGQLTTVSYVPSHSFWTTHKLISTSVSWTLIFLTKDLSDVASLLQISVQKVSNLTSTERKDLIEYLLNLSVTWDLETHQCRIINTKWGNDFCTSGICWVVIGQCGIRTHALSDQCLKLAP